MTLETRPSPLRPNEVVIMGGGKNKTKRMNATTTIQTVVIPPKVNGVILKHASGDPVTISMDSPIGQGYVVNSGDAPLNIPLNNRVDFKYRVVGNGQAAGVLYCLFY